MQKSRKAFNNWKCQVCGQVFRTRREKQHHAKIFHLNQTAWNKGLTKESNQSIAKYVATIMKRYKSGELQGAFKGKHHSLEVKEKLSKIRSNQLDATAGFQDVKWYRVKNILGKEFVLRGLWESNVAKQLNNLNILWERGLHISYIKDGQKRTYTPDFYLPTTNEYIEVKGYYSETDKIKMQLVSEQHPDLKILFIDQWHYNDFISGKISLSSNQLNLWW